MGFPANWRDEAIWSKDYGMSSEMRTQARLLRQVDLLYTKDAADQLRKKETEGGRRSLLNYYRKKGALLSVPGASAHRYPAFQFDPSTGDVKETVVLANRRLLEGKQGTDDSRWSTLAWWLTPLHSLGENTSPLHALESNFLTQETLDRVLTPRNDERSRL